MTRDDIIRMAREAGGGLESDYTNISALARFAALAAAAQQAAEALEEATNYTGCEAWSPSMTDECLAAAAALRTALEQQEQKPVASIYITPDGAREVDDWRVDLPVGRNLLYTAPPALARKEQSDECRWLQDGDSESDLWAASCGKHRYFQLNEGTPSENNMRHCCYCGKPLVSVPIEEGEDE